MPPSNTPSTLEANYRLIVGTTTTCILLEKGKKVLAPHCTFLGRGRQRGRLLSKLKRSNPGGSPSKKDLLKMDIVKREGDISENDDIRAQQTFVDR